MNIFSQLKDNRCVLLQQHCKNWEEVIQRGCCLLENVGAVSTKYCQSIIDSTHEYGAYYIISPHIALPHSSKSSEIIHTALSFMTLNPSIHFNSKHDPIDIVITVAINNTIQGDMMIEQITEFLLDTTLLSSVRTCHSVAKLWKLLRLN